jgi:hypothetical protein
MLQPPDPILPSGRRCLPWYVLISNHLIVCFYISSSSTHYVLHILRFRITSYSISLLKQGCREYEPTIHMKHLTSVWHKSVGLTWASVNTLYLSIFKSTLTSLPPPRHGPAMCYPPPPTHTHTFKRGHFPSKDGPQKLPFLSRGDVS